MSSWFPAMRILQRALAVTNERAFARSQPRCRKAPRPGFITMDPLESRTLLSVYAPVEPLVAFNGSNGAYPASSLIMNAAGDLFGTTYGGGTSSKGTIFKIPAGSNAVTTLASFNVTNGANPYGDLIMDANGNLFGTTFAGGDTTGDPNGNGFGTIFELPANSSTITVLASFNSTNGTHPYDGLRMDSSGNLFGVTFGGGDANGDGTIFELPAGSNTITTLALFSGGAAGANPVGDIYLGTNGDIFGTTYSGGDVADDPNARGFGTIFTLPHGSSTISVLAAFNGTNGANPIGGLVADQAGNLFGTTTAGGDANGDGTLFELVKGASSITLLATFSGGADGSSPHGNLIIDANGNLFGTTYGGGDANGSGVVFELAAGSNTITLLAAFDGAAKGANPWGGLIMDANRNLFGATITGGDIADDTNGRGFGVVFEVSPIGAPAKLAFIQPPSFVSAGQMITPAVTVAIEDAAGHLVDTDSSMVTLALGGSPGVALGGTLSVSAVNGIATFSDLSLPAAGSYTLVASNAALSSATSGPFTVTNAMFTLNGNGTAIANGDASPSATDFTDFGDAPLNHVNGAVTRTYTIQSIVNTSLTLTGNPVITGVNSADFTVSTQPTLTIAGNSSTTFTISFSPTVAGTESATVSFGTSDGSQSPFTFAIQGQGLNTSTATDNLQIATLQAGTGNGAVAGQSLNVLYTGSLLDGTIFDASSRHGNQAFTLTLGASQVISGWDEGLVGMRVGETRELIIPSALGYGTAGSGAIPGGATLIFQVQLLSISGPTLGVSGGGHAIASGDTTLSTADGTDFGEVGIGSSVTKTFNISNLASAGTLKLTGSSPVQISGPGADQFTITQPTLTAQAGSFTVTYTPTIQELATATITIASNDPTYPSFTFSIAGKTAAVATHLVFTQQPANVPVGATIAPAVTVTLQDGAGNTDTSGNASITLTIASGPNGATLGGTTTAVMQNGVATFSDLSISAAGIYTLAASGASLTGGTSNSFVVGAMHLVFVQQPANALAGHTIAPAITVKLTDNLGNIVTSDNSNITLAIASSPSGAALGGIVTVAAQSGVATFVGLSITKAGSYTLVASRGTLNSDTSSNRFTISALAASKLVFGQLPTGVAAGSTMSTQVTVTDQYGNLVASNSSTLKLTLSSGPSGKTAFTLQAKAVHGVASFTKIPAQTAAGAYKFKAAGTGLAAATSAAFTIKAAAAAKLAFARQPSTAVAGYPIAPAVTVQVLDRYGNLVTANSSKVTLSVATSSTGAKLRGTLTVAAASGVAAFSSVSLNQAGTYTLKAVDAKLTAAVSKSFRVNTGTPAQLASGGRSAVTSAIAVIGDSDSDEYAFYPPNRSSASNYVELLAELRGLNFGAYSSALLAPPRNAGYAYDWAQAGATSASMISGGQVAGVAAQAAAHQVGVVIICIGANDLSAGLTSANPVAALDAKATALVSNLASALKTLHQAWKELRVVIATVPDLGLIPSIKAAHYSKSVLAKLTSVTNAVNASLKALAGSDPLVAVTDVAATVRMMSANPTVVVGGITIDTRTPGNDSAHLFLADGGHYGTVLQGLLAGQFVQTLDSAFGWNISPLTDAEIVGAITA